MPSTSKNAPKIADSSKLIKSLIENSKSNQSNNSLNKNAYDENNDLNENQLLDNINKEKILQHSTIIANNVPIDNNIINNNNFIQIYESSSPPFQPSKSMTVQNNHLSNISKPKPKKRQISSLVIKKNLDDNQSTDSKILKKTDDISVRSKNMEDNDKKILQKSSSLVKSLSLSTASQLNSSLLNNTNKIINASSLFQNLSIENRSNPVIVNLNCDNEIQSNSQQSIKLLNNKIMLKPSISTKSSFETNQTGSLPSNTIVASSVKTTVQLSKPTPLLKQLNINSSNSNFITSNNTLSFTNMNVTNPGNKISIPIFSNSLQQTNQEKEYDKNKNYILKNSVDAINHQNSIKDLIDLNSPNTFVSSSIIRPKSNINQSSLILVKTITSDQNKK